MGFSLPEFVSKYQNSILLSLSILVFCLYVCLFLTHSLRSSLLPPAEMLGHLCSGVACAWASSILKISTGPLSLHAASQLIAQVVLNTNSLERSCMCVYLWNCNTHWLLMKCFSHVNEQEEWYREQKHLAELTWQHHHFHKYRPVRNGTA